MTFYYDSDYRLHTTKADNMKPVELSNFDGKCDEYIEGFRYVPEGATWVREDGKKFRGPMCVPWKPYSELDNAQREYERQLLAEYEAALAESVPLSDLTAAYQEGVNGVYEQ